jgi:hypothetical protein
VAKAVGDKVVDSGKLTIKENSGRYWIGGLSFWCVKDLSFED